MAASECQGLNFLITSFELVHRDDEIVSTDVGSALSSDAESITSFSSAAKIACHRRGHSACSRFSTTLETIPATPVAGNHVCFSDAFSFASTHSKKQTPPKRIFNWHHDYSADEGDSVSPSLELFDLSFDYRALPLPPPRSPKRRSAFKKSNSSVKFTPPLHPPHSPKRRSAFKIKNSSVKFPGNAAKLNSSSAPPVMCSGKMHSWEAAVNVQGEYPAITSVMSGPLGTITVKTSRLQQATPLAVMSYSGASTVDGTSATPLPQTPEKPAHEASFLKAQQERVPLQVDSAWSPHAGVRQYLDPMLPAKKSLVFSELFDAEATAALPTSQAWLPLRKSVPSFLLAEPPQMLQPPPGLVCMAR